MSSTITFEGRQWDILKDCGTLYVAHIGDEVRNIPKLEVEIHGEVDHEPDTEGTDA